jgi:DNA-directed RNA polymerase subunit N (RpoN/RPB10)
LGFWLDLRLLYLDAACGRVVVVHKQYYHSREEAQCARVHVLDMSSTAVTFCCKRNIMHSSAS